MNIDIKRIMTENTLVGLTIPAGWTIMDNNLLSINLEELSTSDLKEVVDIYYIYTVFSAKFSSLARAPKHDFYIHITCSTIDDNNYLNGFKYDISYILAQKNKKSPQFSEEITFQNIDELVDNLNKILIKVHYDIDIIIKKNSLDY